MNRHIASLTIGMKLFFFIWFYVVERCHAAKALSEFQASMISFENVTFHEIERTTHNDIAFELSKLFQEKKADVDNYVQYLQLGKDHSSMTKIDFANYLVYAQQNGISSHSDNVNISDVQYSEWYNAALKPNQRRYYYIAVDFSNSTDVNGIKTSLLQSLSSIAYGDSFSLKIVYVSKKLGIDASKVSEDDKQLLKAIMQPKIERTYRKTPGLHEQLKKVFNSLHVLHSEKNQVVSLTEFLGIPNSVATYNLFVSAIDMIYQHFTDTIESYCDTIVIFLTDTKEASHLVAEAFLQEDRVRDSVVDELQYFVSSDIKLFIISHRFESDLDHIFRRIACACGGYYVDVGNYKDNDTLSDYLLQLYSPTESYLSIERPNMIQISQPVLDVKIASTQLLGVAQISFNFEQPFNRIMLAYPKDIWLVTDQFGNVAYSNTNSSEWNLLVQAKFNSTSPVFLLDSKELEIQWSQVEGTPFYLIHGSYKKKTRKIFSVAATYTEDGFTNCLVNTVECYNDLYVLQTIPLQFGKKDWVVREFIQTQTGATKSSDRLQIQSASNHRDIYELTMLHLKVAANAHFTIGTPKYDFNHNATIISMTNPIYVPNTTEIFGIYGKDFDYSQFHMALSLFEGCSSNSAESQKKSDNLPLCFLVGSNGHFLRHSDYLSPSKLYDQTFIGEKEPALFRSLRLHKVLVKAPAISNAYSHRYPYMLNLSSTAKINQTVTDTTCYAITVQWKAVKVENTNAMLLYLYNYERISTFESTCQAEQEPNHLTEKLHLNTDPYSPIFPRSCQQTKFHKAGRLKEQISHNLECFEQLKPDCNPQHFVYQVESCSSHLTRSVTFDWNPDLGNSSTLCHGELIKGFDIDCSYVPFDATTAVIFYILAGVLQVVNVLVAAAVVIYRDNRGWFTKHQYHYSWAVLGIALCNSYLFTAVGEPSPFSCTFSSVLLYVGITCLYMYYLEHSNALLLKVQQIGWTSSTPKIKASKKVRKRSPSALRSMAVHERIRNSAPPSVASISETEPICPPQHSPRPTLKEISGPSPKLESKTESLISQWQNLSSNNGLIIVFVDMILLIVWLYYGPVEDAWVEESFIKIGKIRQPVCRPQNELLAGLVLVEKLVFLLYILYQSYLAEEDSSTAGVSVGGERFMMMSVYNLAICITTITVITLVTTLDAFHSHILVCSCIVFSTLGIICCSTLPQLHIVLYGIKDKNKVMAVAQTYKLNEADVVIAFELGAGSFGNVMKGTYHGTEVAVKKLRSSLSQTMITAFSHEAAIMAELHHPNIVLFMGYCIQPPMLVMEYLARGSLYAVLHNSITITKTDSTKACDNDSLSHFPFIPLDWSLLLNITVDISKGMRFLHQHDPPIVHADLKSPNVLVDANWKCKITDFGLTSILRDTNRANASKSSHNIHSGKQSSLPHVPNAFAKSYKSFRAHQQHHQPQVAHGSLLWAAPELFVGEQPCLATDVYAFGVILFEILYRTVPYKSLDLNSIAYQVCNGKCPLDFLVDGDTPPHINHSELGPLFAQVNALISSCCFPTASQRPSFNVIATQLDSIFQHYGQSAYSTGIVEYPKVPLPTEADWKNQRILKAKLRQADGTLDESDLELGYKIGEGAHGIVFEGLYLGDTKVAVKKMIVSSIEDKAMKEFYKEVNIMKKLHHDNLVQLIGALEKYPKLLIVTELMERGSLWDLYHKEDRLSHEISKHIFQASLMALDIARGMVHLHEQEMIHRDLKSQNVWLTEKLVAKVGDFGMSRITDLNKTMTQCGSPLWCAPEVLEGKRYAASCDMYSFGIICYEIFTWTEPFQQLTVMEMMVAVAHNRERPPHMSFVPKEIQELMNKAWAHSPLDRIDFKAAVETLETFINNGGAMQDS